MRLKFVARFFGCLMAAISSTLQVSSTASGQMTVVTSIKQPTNWTTHTNTTVFLDCQMLAAGSTEAGLLGLAAPVTYNGTFVWRALRGGAYAFGGEQVYASPPYRPDPRYSTEKYQKVGDFGLRIAAVNWTDGANYICDFVTNDLQATATVVVIDELIASVDTGLNGGDTPISGTTVRLTCDLWFGGPVMDPDSGHDQFPSIHMMLGSEATSILDDNSAKIVYVPGKPGLQRHRITQTIDYTLKAEDFGRQLYCVVSTRQPQFSTSSSVSINMSAPAHDIEISPLQEVYAVDDVINCSAKGWPEPSVQWHPVSSSSISQQQPLYGASLTLTAEMIGENVWKCVAANRLNGVNGSDAVIMLHTFNVTTVSLYRSFIALGHHPPAQDGMQNTVLVVGLILGLVALVLVGIIIALLLARRRAAFLSESLASADSEQGKRRQKSGSIYSWAYSTGSEPKSPFLLPQSKMAANGNGPIFLPGGQRQQSLTRNSSSSSTPAVLNRSGHGDLGLGLLRHDSVVSGPDSMMSAGWMDGGEPFLPPPTPFTEAPIAVLRNVTPVSNIFSRPPSVASGTVGQIAHGFADLGAASVRASTNSVNRSADRKSSSPPVTTLRQNSTEGSMTLPTKARQQRLQRQQQQLQQQQQSPDPIYERPRSLRSTNRSLNRSIDVGTLMRKPSTTSSKPAAQVFSVSGAPDAGINAILGRPPSTLPLEVSTLDRRISRPPVAPKPKVLPKPRPISFAGGDHSDVTLDSLAGTIV